VARRRKLPRIAPDEVQDVLAGRREVDLKRLLELIRGVNPTRASHATPAERRERYRLKACLQSLLVARHREELGVFLTRHPGVVALRRVGQRGDGCHAVIADLDPEAQRWVAAALERHSSAARAAPRDSPRG
jgi:hypothetical protein